MELKPCPFIVHGERIASCTISGEYYYNETFIPCMKFECPCYHEDTGDAWCDRSGAYMKLNRRVMTLEEAPIIDAIPVEWLQKKRKYASEGDSLDVGIAEVLDMWEKEQEVQDD